MSVALPVREASIERPLFQVSLADSAEALRESQRLRYRIFAEEGGANIDAADGLDADRFDDFCEHLLVRNGLTGELIATTRVLTEDGAKRAGGYYSEHEFEFDALRAASGPLLEIGRTCVHPEYRSGAAVAVLWGGLARHFDIERYAYLIGCASIPARDGGRSARQLFESLRDRLIEEALRATPRLDLPDNVVDFGAGAQAMPPLLKAYIRLGARIGGEPCWDPGFRCADLLILLPPARIAKKYARHFLGRG